MSKQTEKTKWVKLVVMIYKTVAIEVEEGTEEEMKIDASNFAFEEFNSSDQEVETTLDEEILPSAPDARKFRAEGIEVFPMR